MYEIGINEQSYRIPELLTIGRRAEYIDGNPSSKVITTTFSSKGAGFSRRLTSS
jgi:hypothetical protein